MAYLILEDGQERTESGGYIDFDPKNCCDLNTIENIIAVRRYGNRGNQQQVTLLSASGEDTETLLSRLHIWFTGLFQNSSASGGRKGRTQITASCKKPAASSHFGRRARGVSVA